MGPIDFVVRAFSPHEIEAPATKEIRILSTEAGSFRVEDGKRILFDFLPGVDKVNFWQSFAHPCFGVLRLTPPACSIAPEMWISLFVLGIQQISTSEAFASE
jgi:hypothetical protein